jgi:hypothetical protein
VWEGDSVRHLLGRWGVDEEVGEQLEGGGGVVFRQQRGGRSAQQRGQALS